MLLRTRLTLILSLVFLVVFGGMWLAGTYRASLEQQRLADLAVVTQQSLWNDVVQERLVQIARAMHDVTKGFEASSEPLRSSQTLAVLESAVEADGAVDEYQLQGPDGRLIYATAPILGGEPILDGRSLSRLSGATHPLGGLRQDRVDRFVVTMTLPIKRNGSVVAYLSGIEDAEDALKELSAHLGVAAYLVSFRGRLVEATDKGLWDRTTPEIDAREPGISVVDDNGVLYLTTTIPISDATGGTVGGLVTMRDSTVELVAIQQLERGSFIVLGVFVLIVLVSLYFYLQGAFRPIENSIQVLDALSAGDVEATVEEGGEGEARRIAHAVSVFRDSVVALRDQRAQTIRRQQRQERLIRRELERLAGTLDTEGRSEILGDLATVLDAQASAIARAEDSTITGRIGADTQLVTLAQVLERLSLQITDQHHRLTALVDELREALITKTRLAVLEQELEIAKELQHSLLPTKLPVEPAFDLHGVMHTAKEVGGDFYDFFKFDDRRLALVIADVSGKGVPAALFMAITRTQLRSAAIDMASPADVVARTNAVLATDNEQMMFVTLFYGLLDLETGILTYANAGHNPPLILRASGTVEPLPILGDPALAVIEDIPYSEATATLGPGDALFLYTDGVTEAFDVDGVAFEERRLIEVLEREGIEATPPEIDAAVLGAVKRFERGADQADDITCVALRYHGLSAAVANEVAPAGPFVATPQRRSAAG